MEQNLEMNFELNVVAGNTKKAMSAVGAGKRDLWMVPINDVQLIEGFNVRLDNEEQRAHIRALADSILVDGFLAHKALAGFVANVGGVDVVYLTDGHCRLQAAKLAISEGAEIQRLPVIISPQGTSQEDLTVALVKGNTGKPLTPIETGIVCSRLVKYGWDTKRVSDRLGLGVSYIEDLLSLVAAPVAIRQMVINGQVSAANAVTALRKNGDKAAEKLQAALARAQSAGGKKVTAKHLGGSKKLEKYMIKTAPKLVAAMQALMQSPAFAAVDESLRMELEAILAGATTAQAEDAQPSNSTVEVPTVSEKVAQVLAVATGNAMAEVDAADAQEAQAQAEANNLPV